MFIIIHFHYVHVVLVFCLDIFVLWVILIIIVQKPILIPRIKSTLVPTYFRCCCGSFTLVILCLLCSLDCRHDRSGTITTYTLLKIYQWERDICAFEWRVNLLVIDMSFFPPFITAWLQWWLWHTDWESLSGYSSDIPTYWTFQLRLTCRNLTWRYKISTFSNFSNVFLPLLWWSKNHQCCKAL